MVDALVYAEDAPSRSFLAGLLTAAGLKVETISHVSEAITPCLKRRYRTAIVSLGISSWPAGGQRFEAVRVLCQIDPELPVIVICDEEGLAMERELRSAGIFYFLTRPLSRAELLEVVNCAVERSQWRSVESDQ